MSQKQTRYGRMNKILFCFSPWFPNLLENVYIKICLQNDPIPDFKSLRFLAGKMIELPKNPFFASKFRRNVVLPPRHVATIYSIHIRVLLVKTHAFSILLSNELDLLLSPPFYIYINKTSSLQVLFTG